MRFRRGFTLIELLLALALAAIVITVCYAILVSTIKARNEASERLRWARIQASVFDIIVEDLSQATRPVVLEKLKQIDPNANPDGTNPPPDGEPNPETGLPGTEVEDPRTMPFLVAEDKPDFSEKGGITFVVARPGFDYETETYFLYREVSYFVERDSRSNAYLLYRREQHGWDGILDKGGKAELVCDVLGDFTVEYYDGMEWVDEWETAEKVELPIAVRVKLSFYFERDEKGLPDTSKTPSEFYTVVALRNSRYFHPEDRDRMIREGLIETGEVLR
jgi:prepilin-type N-terminal cleavage/methylation domain-containing protein